MPDNQGRDLRSFPSQIPILPSFTLASRVQEQRRDIRITLRRMLRLLPNGGYCSGFFPLERRTLHRSKQYQIDYAKMAIDSGLTWSSGTTRMFAGHQVYKGKYSTVWATSYLALIPPRVQDSAVFSLLLKTKK